VVGRSGSGRRLLLPLEAGLLQGWLYLGVLFFLLVYRLDCRVGR
jgi:hypothetical protein